jgi:hypothetical protein
LVEQQNICAILTGLRNHLYQWVIRKYRQDALLDASNDVTRDLLQDYVQVLVSARVQAFGLVLECHFLRVDGDGGVQDDGHGAHDVPALHRQKESHDVDEDAAQWIQDVVEAVGRVVVLLQVAQLLVVAELHQDVGQVEAQAAEQPLEPLPVALANRLDVEPVVVGH